MSSLTLTQRCMALVGSAVVLSGVAAALLGAVLAS